MIEVDLVYCKLVCLQASLLGWKLDLGETSRARWQEPDGITIWQIPLSFEPRNRQQLLTQACKAIEPKLTS